jgi:hypothetical protein
MKNLGSILVISFLILMSTASAQKLTFKTVTEQFSLMKLERNYQKIFTSKNQFVQFCEKEQIIFPDEFKFPNIDFSKNYLVLVSTGIQRTGGTSVEITKASKGKSGVLINFTFRMTQPGCPVTDAITYPMDVVLIPKVAKLGNPKFVVKNVSIPCL